MKAILIIGAMWVGGNLGMVACLQAFTAADGTASFVTFLGHMCLWGGVALLAWLGALGKAGGDEEMGWFCFLVFFPLVSIAMPCYILAGICSEAMKMLSERKQYEEFEGPDGEQPAFPFEPPLVPDLALPPMPDLPQRPNDPLVIRQAIKVVETAEKRFPLP